MKILHVVNDANTGGAQTLIESLARECPNGDEAHVLVLMGQGVLSERLAAVAASVSYVGIKRNSKNPINPIMKLRNVVRNRRIDVVHSHLLQSDLIAILSFLRIPVVSTVHTSGAHESTSVSKLISYVVARLSHRFAAVVACSDSAKMYIRTMGYRNATAVPVIPNGSYIPAFEMNGARRRNLVSLSRWHPMKDHRTLFAAFSEFIRSNPDWRLTCAGSGIDSNNAEFTSLLDKYDLRSFVDILGPVKDVDPVLRSAAALVISSSHGEALPMAGIEALARSVPVITTNVGDCASLTVDSRTVVSPRSVEDLTAAMNYIASLDTEVYKGLRKASWLRANARFSASKTVKRYGHVYRSVI